MELQDVARHDTLLSPAGNASNSQVHVPIPSDLAEAAGLNLDSTTEENVYEMAHLTCKHSNSTGSSWFMLLINLLCRYTHID